MNNPTTSFDGIDREPTNAEMARNWSAFMGYFVFVLMWLWIEWTLLLQSWAELALSQIIPVWGILAVVTWKRRVVWFMLSVCIALLAAARSFGSSISESFRAEYGAQ